MINISVLKQEKGGTVIIFLFMLSMLAALAVGALQVTSLNLESARGLTKGKQVYYAAEVGMDTASDLIVNSFENLVPYVPPAGFVAAPNYRGHSVQYSITQPQNQQRYLYQTVNGQDTLTHYAYTYNIVSTATSLTDNSTETLRETIRVLETPLVQWFIFYGGAGAPGGAVDLEIHSGSTWTSWGRIHTNGNLNIGSTQGANHSFRNYDVNNALTPHAITVAGSILPFKKFGFGAANNFARVKTTNAGVTFTNGNTLPLNLTINAGNEVAQEGFFNNYIMVNEQQQQTPGPVTIQRGGFYEQRSTNPQLAGVDGISITGQGAVGLGGITVTASRPAPNTNVTALIAAGQTSPGVAYVGPFPIIQEQINSFGDCREGRQVNTTDIDLDALERWYAQYVADPANGGGALGGGGFLVYASRSPNAAFTNQVGNMESIRLRGGLGGVAPVAQLQANTTFVTDNPLYIQGDFNFVTKQGAALIADSINVLSNSWAGKNCGVNAPPANQATNVNAAFFTGNSPTVAGTYGGGVHNYPRFHENWNTAFTYRGAFINLFPSAQANGNWCLGGNCYSAPVRNWGWDLDFANPANWPPFIPSVYAVERVGFLE